MPISFDDVLAARARIQPFLSPTPARNYPELDQVFGLPSRLFLKHENQQVTGAFKARNAFSALGARLIERGKDYDESVLVMKEIVRTEKATEIHSTNNLGVIAGAGTLSLEFIEQVPELDALIVAVGGGSQAVGAIVVARQIKPSLKVYGVQAEGAPAVYNSWKEGKALTHPSASTFADGLATRNAYDFTLPTLKKGLEGFVTVSDAQIADAVRLLLRTTHNLVEGAGAAALAGAFQLKEKLQDKNVGVVVSGGNMDALTLRKVVNCEI